MNKIVTIDTVEVQTVEGPRTGIIVGLEVHQADDLGGFVASVQERIKLQRMSSPPDTSLMLITLMGDVSAEAFAASWAAHLAEDQVLGVFLSQMSRVDVIHGTRDGRTIGEASLLPGPGPPGDSARVRATSHDPRKKWWQFWK